MPIPRVEYETAEQQTLDEIRDWYRGMLEALLEQRRSLLRAIRDGCGVASRFATMTENELDRYFDSQKRELERLTMLNLVACTEARITDDYFHRVRKKLKDKLSSAYRKWHRNLSAKKQLRPDFDEAGILAVLKSPNLVNNNIVGQFRECLQGRHWVGHGRRWDKPIAIERFDPDDVYDRCNALLRAIPALMPPGAETST